MREIVIENYTKKIKKNLILDNINYKFTGNKIYGLYGRNGSGKTMLLRAISGLIMPTEGSVKIDGKTIGQDIDFPEDLGIIIEHTDLLPQYDAKINLKILSKIRGVASEEDIVKAIEHVGLDPNDKRKVGEYSLGMKQKISIAQAVFENQKILLLDEPTNALDDVSVKNIRDMLLAYKDEQTIIIIASHNKEDLEVLCDVVIRMENGRIEN